MLTPTMNVFFRVDHLYTFFVQWSPDVYGKDAKEQGFVVVEKEELNMIDNFFSEPTTKSWEVSTQEGLDRRGPKVTVCSHSLHGPGYREPLGSPEVRFPVHF